MQCGVSSVSLTCTDPSTANYFLKLANVYGCIKVSSHMVVFISFSIILFSTRKCLAIKPRFGQLTLLPTMTQLGTTQQIHPNTRTCTCPPTPHAPTISLTRAHTHTHTLANSLAHTHTHIQLSPPPLSPAAPLHSVV